MRETQRGFLSSPGVEGPKRRGSLGGQLALDPGKLDEPVESASKDHSIRARTCDLTSDGPLYG